MESWRTVVLEALSRGEKILSSGVEEIKDLPRGQYLKRKAQLINNEWVRFFRSLILPGSEIPSSLGSVKIPDDIRDFHQIADGTNGMSRWFPVIMAPYSDLPTVMMARRSLVEGGNLFPPVYLYLFPLGFFGGQLEIDVWNWPSGSTGEVVAHDLVERKFFVVANCLGDFFDQLAFCIQNNLEFNIVTPPRKLKEFMLDQERRLGVGSSVADRKWYSFDRLDEFPANWKTNFCPDDCSFRLD